MRKQLLLFIFILITSILNAQKYDANFADGKVWFKVKKVHQPNIQKKSNIDQSPSQGIVNAVGQVPLAIKQLPVFSSGRSANKIYKFEVPFIKKPEALSDIFYVTFNQTDKGETDYIINQLIQSGLVEYAEKEPIFKPLLNPNDTYLSQQWALPKVNAFDAWELLKDFDFMTNGSPIVIAVVDDAVNIDHEDLVDVLWINNNEIPGNGIDDDNNGYIDDYKGVDVTKTTNSPLPPTNQFSHGTHVAGIAAAKSNNAKGVSSLAYNAKLMAIKATTEQGLVTAGYSGIIYAVDNGADIINCSWGGSTPSNVLQEIIDYATSNNVIVVGAAGNSGNDGLFYPASYTGVISVANTNSSDLKYVNSNYASRVDISAPGASIYSTGVSGGYENKTGTSMAAPMVASLLGLLKSIDPTIPNEDIKACLFNTAVDLDVLNPTYAGQLGSGRIDAQAAVSCVLNLTESAPIANFSSNIQQITTGASVIFTNYSGYSPTSFDWTFEGGTPSTYSGETPPPIVYQNAGLFSVSLTVSNEFGTHTVTRPNYIMVTEGDPCEAKNLDNEWSWGLYVTSSVTPNSWLFGTNSTRMIQEKAMYFDFNYSAATHITRTSVRFYSDTRNINNHTKIPLKIYDGTAGVPGTLLYTDTSISYSQAIEDLLASRYTTYLHDKAVALPASKKIFIAIDYSALCNTGECVDDLSMFGTMLEENLPNTVWEKLNDEWIQFNTPGSYGYEGNFSIFPYVTDQPFSFDFTIPPTICVSQPANFDGSAINALGSWSVWFDNNSSNSIQNQLQIEQSFATAGSHSIHINAIGGACLDQRINTQTFIVKDTPTVQHEIINPLNCSGQAIEIDLEGAETYQWILPSFIAGYDDASISVVLNQSENLTVIGTNEGCSSTYTFAVTVQESLDASVVLTSSTNLYAPNTSVIFSASGTNLGSVPVYTFYVNDIEQQSGTSTTFTLSDPQLGDKVNVVVSNITGCVVDPLPSSNSIVLTMITLPIYFDYFDAKTKNNLNEISWKLADHQQGQTVILEKSIDGINFSTYASYPFITGSTKVVSDLDIQPLQYYRIKIIYQDGMMEVSNALRIQRQMSSTIKVFPSLVYSGQPVQVQLPISGNDVYKVEIINGIGQVIHSQQIQSNLSLSTSHLSKGMYHVRITNEKTKISQNTKIIVQ